MAINGAISSLELEILSSCLKYWEIEKNIAAAAAAAKSSQSCQTLSNPIDGIPPGYRSWDSPSKNNGVGCHFLLQCMKLKSESEVAQFCPTLCDPMDCSLSGSFVHGIFQARVLEWVAISVSKRILTAKLSIKSHKIFIFKRN